jgi:hypothetical protein
MRIKLAVLQCGLQLYELLLVVGAVLLEHELPPARLLLKETTTSATVDLDHSEQLADVPILCLAVTAAHLMISLDCEL